MDYKYWLTTQGSGFLDFPNEALEILNPQDIRENEIDGRCYSGYPDQCRRRIYLWYSGSPDVIAMDMTIADAHGCCPVIQTFEYNEYVKDVLSSSWPMYLVRSIIEITKRNFRHEVTDKNRFYDVMDSYYPSIDQYLEKAHIRAMKHIKTKSAGDALGEVMFDNVVDAIKEFNSFASREKINSLDETINRLNICYERGIRPAFDTVFFIRDQTEIKDIPKLYTLLEHPFRSVRHDALEAIRRLHPDALFPEDIALMLDEIENKTRDKKLHNEIYSLRKEFDVKSQARAGLEYPSEKGIELSQVHLR